MGKLALGIDIGGTSTKLALIDEKGRLVNSAAFPTQAKSGADAFLGALAASASELMDGAGLGAGNLSGIGIGAPSADEEKGAIEGAANLPFEGEAPVVDYLSKYFNLPVYLIKDSSAALLGEKYFGAARPYNHFALLTLGTGLGCSLMANGKLVRGATGLAGEFGHALVRPGGRQCGCGKRGCLETYVSATGIKRTVFELQAELSGPSLLRRIAFEDLTAHDIFKAAESGDELAGAAFRRTGELLGIKAADLVMLFQPEAVIIAGGLAEAGNRLLDPMQEALEANLLSMHKGKIRLLRSALPMNQAALMGAAALVWDNNSVSGSLLYEIHNDIH
ncbi:MAG: ROK family protein [Lewinellaceae bacterium]|nr:ROK family protein [Lewinella sp.]MCB9277495.1 ROK family protein [Lewinellaceae bacterium]